METCVIQVEMEEFPIFISYSRRDIEQVKLIRASIEKATKVKCWMDLKAIESGSKRFTKDIINGINNCQVFLFMLTDNSQHSEFALRELDFADKKGKKVVIVNIDNCVMSDEFQFLYGLTDTILWIDTLQQEKLLRDLNRWVEPKPEIEITPQNDDNEKRPKAPPQAILSIIFGVVSLGLTILFVNQMNNKYLEGLPLRFFKDTEDLRSVGFITFVLTVAGLYLNKVGTKRAKQNNSYKRKTLSISIIIGRVSGIVSAVLLGIELMIIMTHWYDFLLK